MAIKEVRTGLISQLQTYDDLVTFISSNSGNIKAGMERTIDFDGDDTKIVRVVQMDEDEEYATLSGRKANVEYRFHVVGIHYENDVVTAEDTSADFAKNIKKALCSDVTLSGTVNSIEIGRTYYRSHPEGNENYVLVPVTCRKQELVTSR